ncbi:NAD(P)H-binding protein [Rhizosphaericola mali]|uniref:NAD(P)H-binding protein n=1 Tax=Rhizosphaericola mali TaxID=2545455 RepID=A0A5P2G5E0_9BACT|nr:NAD(P)H-binding protein [Rhizosphaericola mali]QES89032.1 NAD(P)H-binding protein [Rhizosphaericola mali]
MIALVIGATGATGKDLVAQLIQDSAFEKVRIFVRKSMQIQHPKLEEIVVDFAKLSDWAKYLHGDVAFACLGTTLKQAGSKEVQWTIDYDYQYSFAKLAKENGVPHFILLSAYGANENSTIFYSKMKGKLETAIQKLQFSQLDIFKPGVLIRKNTNRTSEKLSVGIIRFFNRVGLISKYKPMSTEILAQSMIAYAKKQQPGLNYVKLQEIFSH